MDLLVLGGLLIMVLKVVLVTSIPTASSNSSLVCSECFHVTFSSDDPGAEIPEDTINEACLKEGEDYTHPDTLICVPGVSYCRKLVGTARMMYEGHEIIAQINARECGEEGNDTVCWSDNYYIPKIFGQKQATNIRADAIACFCDTDMCNEGNAVLASLFLITWMLVFIRSVL